MSDYDNSQIGNGAAARSSKPFTVGSLSYGMGGLVLLFVWLISNKIAMELMGVVGSLNSLYTRDNRDSYTILAYFTMVGSLIGLVATPIYSTWSDRLRTGYGRRRPLLFLAAPLATLLMIAIPFMPDLYQHLMGISWAAALLKSIPGMSDPKQGELYFSATAYFVYGLFDGVMWTVFSYLYYDVVPRSELGRFLAISYIVSSAAAAGGRFLIEGAAIEHRTVVSVVVPLFCLTLSLLVVWRVKEGEYHPPEPRLGIGPIERLFPYFKECFGNPYYLWIFFGVLLFQLESGTYTNMMFYQYQRYDLKMTAEDVNWLDNMGHGIGIGFGLIAGFFVGALTDRWRPLRVLPYLLLARGIVFLLGFVLVQEKISALVIHALTDEVLSFCIYVAMGAAIMDLYPREKLGQFWSAQALVCGLIIFISGMSLRYIPISFTYYRVIYLWAGVCSCGAGLVAFKVYYNWRRRQQELEGALPGGFPVIMAEERR